MMFSAKKRKTEEWPQVSQTGKPIDLENQKPINSHNGMTKETKKTV